MAARPPSARPETGRPPFELEPARACGSRRRAADLSAGLIARELKVTPRAAQDLVAELSLREMTGRGRYRAWGIL